MIELWVDIDYLENTEGLDRLVLHDELGERGDVYYRIDEDEEDEDESTL